MAWKYECEECGGTVRAQSEDELKKKLHQHQGKQHDGESISDEMLQERMERT